MDEDNYHINLYKQIDNTLIDLNNHLFFEKSKSNHIERHESQTQQLIDSESESSSLTKFNLNLNFRKNANTHTNIPILNETKQLRLNIFKECFKDKFDNNNNNISKEEMKIFNQFKREKPFKIIHCDKNVGFLFVSNNNHRNLALKHLNDDKTYKTCSSHDFKLICDKINENLETLLSAKAIKRRIFERLRIKNVSDCKPGRFKILAKIHKEKFDIRPIISCIDHPTSKICSVIDQLLKPIVNSIKTILKDSQQLLQIANSKKFSKKQFIYAGDFVSLYTNIKPDHAIKVIPDFLEKEFNLFLEQEDISKLAFVVFLRIVFECNIFTFEDFWFLQLIGIPMGCICGPTLANIFLYVLEKHYLSIHTDRLYLRFIDDNFIASDVEIDEEELQNQFGYLKLNICKGDSVNFLDLTISFNELTMELEFSLYIKPTNSFSYLKTNSNHPSHIFKNVPVSLFLRARRICSSFIEFLYFSRIFYFQLIKRGYNKTSLDSIINRIMKMDRLSLLPYKNKRSIESDKNLKVFINFESHFTFINNLIYRELNILRNDCVFLTSYKFLFINRMNRNLSDLFVHSLKHEKQNHFSYKNCNSVSCEICKLTLNNLFYLKLNEQIRLPILSDSNCTSVGCIYIIKCKLCCSFYIGETAREIRIRIKEHLLNISKLNKDLRKSISFVNSNSEVAHHFNLKNNFIDKHFSFTVFMSNVIDNERRKSIETDIINILLVNNIKIIN